MFNFHNQRVLVVGGSSGIGLAAAAMAAEHGADITIASRSEAKINAATARIGHGAVGRILDTTDEEAVADFFAKSGTWDHVLVSAAATKVAPVKDLALADAYASMNSKFWGPYRVARAATIRERGSLTLVTGFLSIRPKKGSAIQGAINAGLEGLAKGLALELAPVRVNAISPGFVDTPLWGEKSPADHSALLEKVASGLPTGIAGQADHIALAILAAMQNPYMTGSITYVDGGGSIA